jgi:hypothetical protein
MKIFGKTLAVLTLLVASGASAQNCDPNQTREILTQVVNGGRVDMGACPYNWGCDGSSICRLHPVGARLIGSRTIYVYVTYNGCGSPVSSRREVQTEPVGCTR